MSIAPKPSRALPRALFLLVLAVVAAAIVFLCTDAASYINGAAISVDGGQGGHV